MKLIFPQFFISAKSAILNFAPKRYVQRPGSRGTPSDINLHMLKYNWANFQTLFIIWTIYPNPRSFTPSSVSIINFEHVIAGWDINTRVQLSLSV